MVNITKIEIQTHLSYAAAAGFDTNSSRAKENSKAEHSIASKVAELVAQLGESAKARSVQLGQDQ